MSPFVLVKNTPLIEPPRGGQIGADGDEQGGVEHDPDQASRGAISQGSATEDSVGSLETSAVGSHAHTTPAPRIGDFPEGDSGGGSHAGFIGGTYNTNAAGGAETRPVNVYVMYAIYAGVPQ